MPWLSSAVAIVAGFCSLHSGSNWCNGSPECKRDNSRDCDGDGLADITCYCANTQWDHLYMCMYMASTDSCATKSYTGTSAGAVVSAFLSTCVKIPAPSPPTPAVAPLLALWVPPLV